MKGFQLARSNGPTTGLMAAQLRFLPAAPAAAAAGFPRDQAFWGYLVGRPVVPDQLRPVEATKRSGPLAERDGGARVRRPLSCPCGHRDVVGGNSATGLCTGHLGSEAGRPVGDVRTLIEDPIRRLLDGADPQPMLSEGVTHRLRASPRSWSRSPHVQQPGAGAHPIWPAPGPEQPDRGGTRSRRRRAAARSFRRSVGIRPALVGRGAAPN